MAPTLQERSGLKRWEKGALLALLVGLVGAHLGSSVARGRLGKTLRGADEQCYYSTLRSVVFDRDIDYTNELRDLTPYPDRVDWRLRTPTGRVANKTCIGYSLVAAGPYLAVHGAMTVLAKADGATGYEPAYQLATTLAHLLAGWVGMVFLYKLIRRSFGPGPSLAAAIVALVGSPLFFYSVYALHMPHAASFMAVVLFLYASDSLARDWTEGGGGRLKTWLLLGFSGALMFLVRYSNIVFLLVPVCLGFFAAARGQFLRTGRGRREALRGLVISILVATPFALIQLGYWHALHGSWISNTYAGEGFDWLRPALWGYLFSHRHGVFFFAPAVLVGAIGLVVACVRPGGRGRAMAMAMLLSLAALVYLNSAWWSWWFGDGFGGRSFIAATPGLCWGMAWALSRASRRARWALGAAMALGILWTQVLLALQFRDLIADDGSSTLGDIVRAITG